MATEADAAEQEARAKKLAEIEKITVTTVEVKRDYLDEDTQGMLDKNFHDREKLANEIRDMKIRSEKRKIERADQEKAEKIAREEENARRKAEKEERERQKEEEALMRKLRRENNAAAAAALASQNEGGSNFKISKKEGGGGQSMKEREKELQAEAERIAKEQAEAEKQVVLAQRIFVLDIEGFNADKLRQKVEGLFAFVKKLVGEVYDQEKRYKDTGIEIQDLTARARQQQLAGGGGSVKRVKPPEGEVDKIQEKYSGAPDKVLMYSIFERSQDKRTYEERHMVFHGPVWAPLVARIFPTRKVAFNADSGLPTYIPLTEEEIAEYIKMCADYQRPDDGSAPEVADGEEEFVYTGPDDDEE